MKAEVCTLVITALLFMGCSGVDIRYPTSADPCIIVKMEGNLSLSMIPTGGQAMKTDGDLNGATIASGYCAESGKNMASVTLVLSNGVLSLGFKKGADSKVTMDVKFTFIPNAVFKNGETGPVAMESASSKPLSKDTASYTCTAKQEIKFNNKNVTKYQYEMKMTISDVQIQAFDVHNTFSPAEDCTALVTTTEQPAGTTTKSNEATTVAPTTKSNETTTKAPTTKSNETTTEAPTTKSNGTTTEAPTTKSNGTTTEAPTTKMATTTITPGPPTPKPGSPHTNKYTARNSTSDALCLMITAGIEFVIPYVAKAGNKTKTIGIPSESENTTFHGNCEGNNHTQTVTITFYNDWELTMTFASSEKQYHLSRVYLNASLRNDLITDIATPINVIITKDFGKDQFSASKSGSYKCDQNSKLTLGNGFEMDTYKLQYAAFQSNITAFSSTDVAECPADTKTNSVVPIAVGAALAALVVIVLIAYLIGRKRSRQSGYEQV